ncbi:MAG: GNAT family N-acetyltransferase [Actinomycetota bacterium]
MEWSLREIVETDAEWIFDACQDPLIQRWTKVPRPYLREHAIAFTKDLAGELAVWAIIRVEDSRPCGVIGVHTISEPEGSAEIGYWMAPWGRGLGGMKVALELLINRLREWPTVTAVEATLISEENIPSRKTLEAAGFDRIESENERLSFRREITPR